MNSPNTKMTPAEPDATEPVGGGMIRLAKSLRRLSDLYHDEHEFEADFDRPTQAAYDFAWRLLTEMAAVSTTSAEAVPSTLGDGGIIVEFRGGKSPGRLVVPPSADGAYAYVDGEILPAEADRLGRRLESEW